jgi:5-carboxymethyl-2-hydroxymuconate isomerase
MLMPHCVIEYSAELAQDINTQDLISQVFQAALESTLFAKNDIKVRATPFCDYQIGDASEGNDTQQRFIHVCCKILSGRNVEQRQNLSQLVLSQLVKLNLNSVSMSVEIVDMERESYNKQVSRAF